MFYKSLRDAQKIDSVSQISPEHDVMQKLF